ncbi:MAG: MFS transporter [Pseudomonadota bacterium]
MSGMAKFALMLVVFVDLIGQGLVFPVLNTMIMSPDGDFLSKDTSQAQRHFSYGLVIAVFFTSWALGVMYVSKVSDAIGRKKAILVCLFGALAGYALTIVAVMNNSMLLLLLGRAVTGFTAGNQPISQAAMIDASKDDAERDRNMGLIVAAISTGLVGGPIIGAILSQPALLGSWATTNTPFIGALVIVAFTMAMVVLFFHDIRTERTPFVFRPLDVVDSLLRIKEFPNVRKLLPVYTFFMVPNVTFYVFADNYLTSKFGYGIIGSSVVMVVIGIALATSSTFLVGPAQARFTKTQIVLSSLVVMALCAVGFVTVDNQYIVFVFPFLFYFFFGISYPTLLGLFSSTVAPTEQGWVMGVTTVVFTLAGGIMSLAGGTLMRIDINMPYYIVILTAGIGLLLLFTNWYKPAMKQLVR